MDCLDLCLDLYDKLCSFMAVGVLLDEISQEKHGKRERERERERERGVVYVFCYSLSSLISLF